MRRIYYSVMAVFVVWGCIALNLAQPLTLVVISANVAGLNFVIVSIHTLVVNRRFLPPDLRPSLGARPCSSHARCSSAGSPWRRSRAGSSYPPI